MNDTLRVSINSFCDSRPDELVTIEHSRDDHRGGRITTSLYLAPDGARVLSELIHKVLCADRAPFVIERRVDAA